MVVAIMASSSSSSRPLYRLRNTPMERVNTLHQTVILLTIMLLLLLQVPLLLQGRCSMPLSDQPSRTFSSIHKSHKVMPVSPCR